MILCNKIPTQNSAENGREARESAIDCIFSLFVVICEFSFAEVER